MAEECRDVIDAIRSLMERHLDSSLIDQLDEARKHLESVFKLLWDLEQRYPENAISTGLRLLFLEARDGFSEKSPPEVLKIIKCENIAGRLKASKPSRSFGQITREMVCFVEALLDCTSDILYIAPISVLRVDELHMASRYMHELLVGKLRTRLRYVRIFFTLTARWCIQHESMKDFFTHVENVAYTAANLHIKRFAHREDSEFLELLERLSPLNRESRQIYLCVSTSLKSSRSEASMNEEDMLIFVRSLQEDLQVLLNHDAISRVYFESLDNGLSDICGLMGIRGEDWFELRELVSLRSHMEDLAIEAAIMIYSDGKETGMPLHLKLVFSHVRLEINLVEILKWTAHPPNDLISYVLGELIFLGNFLVDGLKHLKEKTKFTNFLTLIQCVTSQACSDIDSLSQSEYLTGDTTCLHFQLLLKFTFIKAVIRQMCLPVHSTVELLDFFPISLEAIDSYFSMLTSSSYRPNMDVVLMGLLEYILDNSLLKCKSNMTIIVADEVEKFYHGLLLLATHLFNEAYEDSNKSWTFSLVFQFLTEAFKLVKYERRLMDLLNQKGTLEAEILDLIKTAHEELILLVTFLMDVLRQRIELNKFNHLLVRVEVTAQRLAQISDLLDVGSTEKLRLSLCAYLQGIESAKVDVRKVCVLLQDASPCNMTDGEDLIKFLLSHQEWPLKHDTCSFSILKDQIPVIKDGLVCLGCFLADFVQYHDMHQELKELTKCVRDRKYVCLFPIEDNRPAWYDILYLSDVKQLLKFVEDKVKSICLKVLDPSVYRFPQTDGLGFLNCFLGKLEELLQSKLHSNAGLKHQIESVKEGLLCLRSLVDHLAESYDEDDETCAHITSVTEIAYKAEHVFDSCLAYSHPPWYKVFWISEVVGNIKLVNKVVSDAFGREKIDVRVHKAAKTAMIDAPSSSASTPRENEEMEGFEEAMGKIKEQLLGGSSQLDIISIVDMPGIGKTTLAEKIYNDLTATPHFDVHAKCRVTQSYSWKELLLTILNNVCGPADRTQNKEDGLADDLRRFLLTKRFLVLVDDVWDTTIWDNLCMCFRGSQNRSRIILTTRLSDIASYAKCESTPHHLRLFRNDESWRLLQELVFQGDSCPPNLVDVGIRIAKSCGGLPLFIVLVAGVLKMKRKNADMWKEVEESIGSQNIGSVEESMSLIGFSYKNLPLHLKPCFLYFGGFLKGKDIHVSKLARLWQVEGFLQANERRGTEDSAQEFLEDLISRNLVMAMEKKPNDKVKRCRIHDLLHNFCLEKSKQENFLNKISREEDILPEKPKDYRLFIHSYQDEIDLWLPYRSNIRSLHIKVTDPDNLSLPHNISFIFDRFKLVKVLDLESFNMGNTFPTEVQSLVYLRYFSVQTEATSIPSFIAKLQNLETFVVRGLEGEVILPCALLKIIKLKHIVVKHRASFSLHENMGELLANSQLDNLEAFSTPRLSYGEDAEMILKKMPNLRKLSCIFSGTFGNSEKGKGRIVRFPRLAFLNHLESLKLISNRFPAKLPHDFNFPSKLRELTLSKFHLPWSEISIIGELPNLEILRLLFRAFEGNHWEVNDSEFPELKYLKLDNINISRWSVSDDAFPKLEHLVLTKCNRLEEVPYHFGEATSLKSVEVNWCGQSVSDSALMIQTMQRKEYANDAFTVAIQPPIWTGESAP